ncbi:hypothetical protein G6F24_016415 [Rhizopus arrhizus]|nr:hypothetical protein G6F24_016415 [Rhizopus arrhizus]
MCYPFRRVRAGSAVRADSRRACGENSGGWFPDDAPRRPSDRARLARPLQAAGSRAGARGAWWNSCPPALALSYAFGDAGFRRCSAAEASWPMDSRNAVPISGVKRSGSSEPNTSRPTAAPSASRRRGTSASDFGVLSSQPAASNAVSVPQYGVFRLSVNVRTSCETGSP